MLLAHRLGLAAAGQMTRGCIKPRPAPGSRVPDPPGKSLQKSSGPAAPQVIVVIHKLPCRFSSGDGREHAQGDGALDWDFHRPGSLAHMVMHKAVPLPCHLAVC